MSNRLQWNREGDEAIWWSTGVPSEGRDAHILMLIIEMKFASKRWENERDIKKLNYCNFDRVRYFLWDFGNGENGVTVCN